MRPTTLAIAAAIAVGAAGSLWAAETGSQPANRTALALTLYGNGLALIKDQRQIDLPPGINDLSITGVSPQMIPDSLYLNHAPGLRMLTRTLRSANLNARTLLEAHVGKAVQLIRTHPQTGAESTIDATLVSVRGGVIARIGGRLVSNPVGRWAFPDIPNHLRADPILALGVESARAGPRKLGLRYLSNGLSWHAAYTANWDREAGKLRLAAWASLKNAAGIDFDNAGVQVVAGQVRRVTRPRRPMARASSTMMKSEAVSADAGAPVREALAGYHLYTLPEAVTLKHGETVQAVLLKPLSLPVTRELVSEGHPAVYGHVRGGAARPTHPAIRLKFDNKADENAQPLPAGTLRLYGADKKGAAQFLGEDRIGDVPVGGRVTLNAGNAFDLTVRRAQTDFQREGRNRFEVAFEIELRNGSAAAQTVKVVESIPGEWHLIGSDKPNTRENNQAVWRIEVPAKGRVTFNYRVRVQT